MISQQHLPEADLDLRRSLTPEPVLSRLPPANPAEPEVPLAPSYRRPRIGLALSCGAAKGLAHIGVIQVLEEHGIHIDAIAGSSMGAYIGAIWGFGHTGMEMEALACELEGHWSLLKLLDPAFLPRRGFLKGERVKRRIQKTIGTLQFSDMVRPVKIVATDLQTLERKVFSQGEVAAAVHASVAIPGVCIPVRIDGREYMDGGIADPLPVDVLREMGMDRIIAVNTIPTPSFMCCCEEREREEADRVGKRSGWLSWLNAQLNVFANGNILDTMMRAVHGAQLRVAEASGRRADLVLRPLSIEASWIEFDRPMKYIEIGRRVAEQRMDEIQALLQERIPTHEHTRAHLALGSVV